MYQEQLCALSANAWEWFAQDVLFHLGFSIITGPSEGVDGGMDLVVEFNNVKYLVSCKHYLNSGRSAGVNDEINIHDRLLEHRCGAFLPFYSTNATTSLKTRFEAFRNQGISVYEIYLDNILDIIPTMRGYILQKYFPRPQSMHHHNVAAEYNYKPLVCMHPDCNVDLLQQASIPWSLAGIRVDENNTAHLIYGCKRCVANYCNYPEWVEIEQIRYIEEMLSWRETIDEIRSANYRLSYDFFESWSNLQEGILQIQIPQGWGVWLF